MNPFLEEIHEQPEALMATAAYLSSDAGTEVLSQIRERWESGRYSRMVFTGMGSSYFLSCSAAGMLAACGMNAFAVNTGELLHYGRGIFEAEDTFLVIISQSGESYEVVELLKRCSGGAFTVGLTNRPESTLGAGSDLCLLTIAGEEEMTSTKTFITGWQVCLSLVNVLLGKPLDKDWVAVADAVSELLGSCDTARALSFLKGKGFIQLCARGPQMCTASQSALMFMEASHTSASALTGGDFRHGPMEMVGDGIPVIIFSHSLAPTRAQMLRLAEDVVRFGGKVIFVTDEPVPESGSLTCLVAPAPDEDVFPITSVVPVQLLVNDFAVAKGLTPGDFSHGNKITRIE